MTSYTDQTNDPAMRSWVESASDPASDFPVQNLPYCVFHRPEQEGRHIGVGIGDRILDLHECVRLVATKEHDDPILNDLAPPTACALMAPHLNDLMRQGTSAWREARAAAQRLLREDDSTVRTNPALQEKILVAQQDARYVVPASIGDYTDFYCSLHHATNVGSMFRPDNPLLPNYRHLPIGYHGRASSVVISGTPVRRPMGQTRADDAEMPTFGPCRLLDYEMEMGFFVGPGNDQGERIDIADAARHIFGMCIVNDWSARDVQKWEYQPLGPFNAKNFSTTISPWVVTMDALAPYRVPGPTRPDDHPPMLEYLQPADDLGLDITVEVWIASERMRSAGTTPVMVSRGTFADMYWTIGQMLVQHTTTGCNLQPGDLIASGTVSNQAEESRGCLLERTWRGQNPIDLPDGTQRKFLQDGDEVIMQAYCQRNGQPRIGFGECRGLMTPAT